MMILHIFLKLVSKRSCFAIVRKIGLIMGQQKMTSLVQQIKSFDDEDHLQNQYCFSLIQKSQMQKLSKAEGMCSPQALISPFLFRRKPQGQFANNSLYICAFNHLIYNKIMKAIYVLCLYLFATTAFASILGIFSRLCKEQGESCEVLSVNPKRKCCLGLFCTKQDTSTSTCTSTLTVYNSECQSHGQWCNGIHGDCCSGLNCRKLGGDLQTMTCEYPGATAQTATTCRKDGDSCGELFGTCCTDLYCGVLKKCKPCRQAGQTCGIAGKCCHGLNCSGGIIKKCKP